MTDFDGDPGPINFTENGTFFGKLLARNVLEGKKIIVRHYTMTEGDDVVTEVRALLLTLSSRRELVNGEINIKAKDALKDIEKFSDKFPPPSEVELTQDIALPVYPTSIDGVEPAPEPTPEQLAATFTVSDASGFADGDIIRINDELMRISGNPSGNTITVVERGTSLVSGLETVYKTEVDTHSYGDTVQGCYGLFGQYVYDVLKDLFTAAGMAEFIDYAQWKEEVEQWNKDSSQCYGVLYESESFEDTINLFLSSFMLDMWLDQPTQKLKLSAVSAWKDAAVLLNESSDIQELTIKPATVVVRCRGLRQQRVQDAQR